MARLFHLRSQLGTTTFSLLLSVLFVIARPTCGQNSQSENKSADGIHGTVINSVTHEPIGHALVYFPDNRLAAMTDSEGHFEFTVAKPDNDNTNDGSGSANKLSYRRGRIFGLMARKPGFIEGRVTPTVQSEASNKEVVLSLTPESLVIGRVLLSSAEASDPIQLELYRRQVAEGRAHWVLAGSTSTKSNGEFRFAELPAGSYKLLTRELMDRDPLASDPRSQVYGYPPVYFPNATDFAGGQAIQLAAGQVFQADISLVRHAYYPVKVAVANSASAPGISIVVSVQGHRGPGYALGYNHREQTIEGLLPNGNYTLEASSFGANGASGVLNISIKGAPVEGPRMTLVPNGSIGVNIKEEFTSTEDTNRPRYVRELTGTEVSNRAQRDTSLCISKRSMTLARNEAHGCVQVPVKVIPSLLKVSSRAVIGCTPIHLVDSWHQSLPTPRTYGISRWWSEWVDRVLLLKSQCGMLEAMSTERSTA